MKHKNVIAVVILASLLIVSADVLARPPKARKPAQKVPEKEEPAAPDWRPSTRLSPFLDAHLDQILSPLDSKIPPLPRSELQNIRAKIGDAAASSDASKQPCYQVGLYICNALTQAMDSRDEHLSRSGAAANAPSGKSKLDTSLHDAETRHAFFQTEVTRDWDTAAQNFRRSITQLQKHMKTLEHEVAGTMIASIQALPPPPEFQKNVIGHYWSWERTGTKPATLQFLADGTAKHQFFTAGWRVNALRALR